MFDPILEVEHIIDWIRDYFLTNANKDTKAVIGISGGKDSSIAAALCVAAIGPERVIGVRLPQGEQHDIDVARKICEYLHIESYEINIKDTCDSLYATLNATIPDISTNHVVATNTPARIRMSILYAIAGAIGGRVVNTCNRSEDFVGYSTKFGDTAGDFSPLSKYTVREIIQMGKFLLPEEFFAKTPEDGMTGKSDEENFGFTYNELDDFILHGIKPSDNEHYWKLMKMHLAGLHKVVPMPVCPKSTDAGDIVEFKNGHFIYE